MNSSTVTYTDMYGFPALLYVHSLLLVQRHSPKYQDYCALFDKSTKIGTYSDYHLISIFGYGGTPKCAPDDHSSCLYKMAVLKT